MTDGFRTSSCRSCGALIIWASTTAGRAIPVDTEPAAGGNVELTVIGSRVVAVVLGSDSIPADGKQRRTSHFATCPDAPDWRKRK